MASYLLLRNNKESGPYGLNDLVKEGLKPYDLVWVQGKSAAWRYPSEIEELKPYAPVVEEQPYDRFFKKKEPAAAPSPAPTPSPQKFAPPPVPDPPRPHTVSSKYTPKKSVFVTLPGQQPVANPTVQPQPAAQKEQTASPAAMPPSSAEYAPQPVTDQPAPVIIVSENPAAAKVNQSNSLEDIRDRYAKTLQNRKDKLARKSFWLASLKKAAVIAGLVLTGTLAGFLIRSDSGQQPVAHHAAVQSAAAALDAAQPVAPDETIQSVPAPEPENPATTQLLSQETQRSTILQPVPEKIQPGNRPSLLQEKAPALLTGIQQQALATSPLAEAPRYDETATKRPEINDQTGERNRRVRDEAEEKKPAVAENKNTTMPAPAGPLAKQVSVASNDYTRVAFGGIRNLELTVTNNSKHKLDEVVVELQYLKPNLEPLKTEQVRFADVSSNASVTRKIKDTNRGIRVAYRIINIQPQQPPGLSAF